MSGNYCEQIPVIPQNLETCWFNTIIMAMIYSDGLSQLIYEKAVEDNWDKDENGAFKTLMLLFMNYIRAIKEGKVKYIQKLRKFLKKYRIEIILLDFINHYNPEFIQKYYQIIFKGYYLIYFEYILKVLKFNSCLIKFNEDKFHILKITQDSFDFDTEFNSSVNPDILLYYGFSIQAGITEGKLNNFGEEIIEFNGFQYKLDCILLTDKDKKHAIIGLTCNGSKYVYNGVSKERQDENPCNLMPFDWTTDTTNFCLNREECSLPKDLDKGDMCFNFKNNERLMVYVKIKDKIELKIKEIKRFNRIPISPYIDKLDIETIKQILIHNGYLLPDNDNDKTDTWLRSLFKGFLKYKYKISSLTGEEELSPIISKKSLSQKFLNKFKKLYSKNNN